MVATAVLLAVPAPAQTGNVPADRAYLFQGFGGVVRPDDQSPAANAVRQQIEAAKRILEQRAGAYAQASPGTGYFPAVPDAGAVRPRQRPPETVVRRPDAVALPATAEEAQQNRQEALRRAAERVAKAEAHVQEVRRGEAAEPPLGATTGTTPPLAASQREQLLEMEARVASVLPRQPSEGDAEFSERVAGWADSIVRPFFEAQERAERERARHEAYMRDPLPTMNIPVARRQFAERMTQQEQFQRQQVEQRFRLLLAEVGRYDRDEAFRREYPERAARGERPPSAGTWTETLAASRAEHRRWCEANVENCAREQRRLAAQAEQARIDEQRRAQWQVAHATRRVCQPLAEYIPGTTNPDEALAALRRVDPDADYNRSSAWRMRDESGVTRERPWVTIEMTHEQVLLAKDYAACVAWFRAAGR
jgi:hypothetical protein